MNRKFASYLVAGKIAAMPVLGQESLAAVQDAAARHRQGEGRVMDLVITGLRNRDEVMVVISPEKNTGVLIETITGQGPDQKDLRVVGHFSALDVSSKILNARQGRQLKAVSIPVVIPPRHSHWGDEQILYTHILVAPDARWEKSLVRYAGAAKISASDRAVKSNAYGDVTEDCTPYTC